MALHSKWVSGNLVYFNKLATGGIVQHGEYASLVAGSGILINSSRTAAHRIYGDDGGVALTAGAYRAGVARMLLATACSAGDISVYGHESQLRVAADYSAATGVLGGQWGYLELVSGGKVNAGGALVAHLDVPTGAYASGNVAGVYIKSNTLAGTHTGKVCAIYVVNSQATAWDAFLGVDASSDIFQDSAAGSAGHKYLKLYYGGKLYTIDAACGS